VLLARRSKVLDARSKFLEAQQALSLYYRSESLVPMIVDETRAPKSIPALRTFPDEELGNLVEMAMNRRPELLVLEEERKQARADLRLAANQRLPKLDLELFAARDLGTGDPSLRRTDTGLGLSFELPIGRRKATGKAKSARAKLAATKATTRGLRDRITADLRALAALSKLRGEQAELAEERWRASEELARAERARLKEGASDVLTVNLREKDVAAAASDAIESALAQNKALAELYFSAGLLPMVAGTGDLRR
jgi:outer membrane protein TolC